MFRRSKEVLWEFPLKGPDLRVRAGVHRLSPSNPGIHHGESQRDSKEVY
jgi:hypothetical protein